MVALAPMGYTPPKLDVTVVERPETMRRTLPAMVALYEGLVRAWRTPVGRWIVSRKLAPDARHALATHVLPTMQARLEGTRAGLRRRRCTGRERREPGPRGGIRASRVSPWR